MNSVRLSNKTSKYIWSEGMLIGYAIKPTTMNSATDAVGEKAIACKGLLNKALPMK
jgi:hypothetical protein